MIDIDEFLSGNEIILLFFARYRKCYSIASYVNVIYTECVNKILQITARIAFFLAHVKDNDTKFARK